MCIIPLIPSEDYPRRKKSSSPDTPWHEPAYDLSFLAVRMKRLEERISLLEKELKELRDFKESVQRRLAEIYSDG